MELGRLADGDPRLAEVLASLKGNRYLLFLRSDQPFDWLRETKWTDACAFVRGLTRAEIEKLTNLGGSVSPVKDAYHALEEQDRVAAMEVAVWIVDHSNNDYIPFPMRKIRHAFERIKQEAGSWAECREKLDAWNAGEWARQNRVAQEMANQKPEGEHRRQIQSAVAARIKAEQAEVQHAKASAREKLLAELRALPVRDRLEHIAWDDTRTLTYYPSDLAVCAAEDLEQLDPVTKSRFIEKLRARKKGPWHKLSKQLGLS